MQAIPTYIINLAKRTDRKAHCLKQFANKPEFDMQIVKAIENERGALGLWQTIKYILQNLSNDGDEFVLICEDDHIFNPNYSKELLFQAIKEAMDKDAAILAGGVSWLNSALQVSRNIYWMEKFTGLQFAVIFRNFFTKIIEAEFATTDVADLKICSLTNKKFFIHPFISAQKEFGYSDVTSKNNIQGRVEKLFDNMSESVQIIKSVTEYFAYERNWQIEDVEQLTIPTYIISRSSERLGHISGQFLGKAEFEVNIVDANTPPRWNTMRKIVEMAITNDDDIIIICEDTHEFTPHYSKQFLLENIMGAFYEGADILLGGTANFGVTVPITGNRLWIGSFSGTSFLILYKSIFMKILDESISETATMDEFLSELTSNKMVLYPFISLQKDFVQIESKSVGNTNGEIANPFSKSEQGLDNILQAYRYHSQWPKKVY